MLTKEAAYNLGTKIALDDLSKTAWNPFEEEKKSPLEQFAQGAATGAAGIGAGGVGSTATGLGTLGVLRALKKSPKTQAIGALLGSVPGFWGASVPTGMAVHEAFEDED